jgi:hypothetical protein
MTQILWEKLIEEIFSVSQMFEDNIKANVGVGNYGLQFIWIGVMTIVGIM